MKKRKGKNNGLNQFIDKFNQRQTKGNIENTMLKGLVDVAGVAAGTGLGALAGSHSKFVGLATIIGGHYLGDKSNVLRIIGASTLAYGIAKAKDYGSNPIFDSSEARLADLKDNWLTTLYLKMKDEKKKTKPNNENDSEVTVESIASETESTIKGVNDNNIEVEVDANDDFTNLDFSGLDKIEDDLFKSANEFQDNKNPQEEDLDDPDFSLM